MNTTALLVSAGLVGGACNAVAGARWIIPTILRGIVIAVGFGLTWFYF
ncbi:hypothetical protein [Rhizobium sp. L1K21]|nr:hypothetical protein [Rhizobium sp. L1K21]MCO6187315.1 hypothetical protein [Rhizobium sp. L1K21]